VTASAGGESPPAQRLDGAEHLGGAVGAPLEAEEHRAGRSFDELDDHLEQPCRAIEVADLSEVVRRVDEEHQGLLRGGRHRDRVVADESHADAWNLPSGSGHIATTGAGRVA
jgi:hypothetical protein